MRERVRQEESAGAKVVLGHKRLQVQAPSQRPAVDRTIVFKMGTKG